MQKIDKSHFILTVALLLILAACKGPDKKEAPAETTDTTQTATAEPVAQDAVMDAVKAAPDLYKILNDTMGIRIVEVTYKPGDSSALHSHPDLAAYAAAGGTVAFYGKDGTKMENEMKTGTSLVRPGEVHSVKNAGKTTLKVILVEVNRPMQTTSQDATLDATKVAPTLYKLKNDTLGIRVLEISYKPGQSSAMHSHPDNALYVIEGGKGEFTGKDGTKNVMEFKKGMTAIGAADTHSVKNVGTTTLKAILVEVNRAK
ncbi:cupin domain-containing protein [Terrimonas pollutisoli]|uniref:cupin domain-containing protein n=1 Tax=Terrimonas pollutisoli TaxID=3034147 RepID=UPI0023EBA9DC|nr:cupin domain-containing protein [Terrimonas sp. H1YJ31]